MILSDSDEAVTLLFDDDLLVPQNLMARRDHEGAWAGAQRVVLLQL